MTIHRDTGLTTITVHNDRPAHKTRPDPVVAGDGVFGEIEAAELSAEETARIEGEAQRQKAAAEAEATVKRWTPKAILERLTLLYRGFIKPGKASE